MKPSLSYYDGTHVLSWSCEPGVPVSELGLEPNGYFWEGVVEYLHPELMEDLDFDSEAGMFCAMGPEDALATIRESVAPFLADARMAADLAREAQDSGFTFDC